MKKDFDFDDIGKLTPYRRPDGFFESVQRKVWERAGMGRLERKHRLRRIALAAVAVAAVVAGLLFVPSLWRTTPAATTGADGLMAADGQHVYYNDPVDEWIVDLSDEELEEFVSFSENDIFLY